MRGNLPRTSLLQGARSRANAATSGREDAYHNLNGNSQTGKIEAKEEKREKDCRYRYRAWGRGLRDSIRKKNVARCFNPRIACRRCTPRNPRLLRQGALSVAAPGADPRG